MKLPFLDRTEELARLGKLLSSPEGSLAVLFGRRRTGKSRLLQEALGTRPSVYYVCDDREGPLQRKALAREIGRRLAGFDAVDYPDWDSLFGRWWDEAEPGMALALDEFPALVGEAREVPSILQKYLDRPVARGPKLVLAGSAQRMMQGLVLDRAAPLFGRAREILKIHPLPCGWIRKALGLAGEVEAVESYAVWGGIPRYWELAADFRNREEAVGSLVLSPFGVLHDEPSGLLLDDLREIVQAASILTLIGQGCHRISEIAGRLGKPATSLSRPLQRLLDLEMVRRDFPFGSSSRDSKRTLYRISDPFLRFWFRFVEPNRSRLGAGQVPAVAREIAVTFSHHVSGVWEDLVRESVPRTAYHGETWKQASPWWGPGLDGKPMEIDVIAESEDGSSLLIGGAKWTQGEDPARLAEALRRKMQNFPLARGRKTHLGLWLKRWPRRAEAGVPVHSPHHVLAGLR